jgi:tRNA (guanine37-N1)-methyltransferase
MKLPQPVLDVVGKVDITPVSVTLDYRNFSLQDILKPLLPDTCVIPSSFETAGHIAHLNLSDEQFPFRKVIGEAILLKNPAIETIVCKIGSIHSVYRSMDLELIAGKPKFETEVHQSGLRFQLDFSKVYWNSRLEVEHNSLVETFQEGSVVADAMCGIGPFAVRAALRKNCQVLANDLNPDSYKWLQKNVELNGVSGKVKCFNMDARDFIRKVFQEGGCDYLIMNLPASAIEFLDAVGEAALKYRETARLPIVHFHSFDGKNQNLLQRARDVIKMDLKNMSVLKIRNVAPGKDMYRCSFAVADLFGDGEPSGPVKP